MSYRVFIAIYDDEEMSREDFPVATLVHTDEPLMSGAPAEEMAVQAHRTHRHFINYQASEQ